MTIQGLDELLTFAKEQGLMQERFDLVCVNFLVLSKSWKMGLIQGK